ncbi:MAG: hypothetical protein A3K19_13375 [Lentisphaerae bacterium RIFOXYB12_FULL_65_16]|nr:MAG: hypothetical protein A3K18_28895 [Lentisphaerae bacterium RIFOXYA12_64_32]OGV86284.1 MAG: hypothetical protein A3K19_13375 [Lentisphaerae bacterium RIFOXYB12_FULL_65_16]
MTESCPANSVIDPPARTLARRVAAHWRFKLFVGTALTVAFLALYLLLQRHTIRPATLMPLSALDRWIGFRPGAAVLYESLWLYIPIGPWLLTRRAELDSYCRILAVMSCAGFAVFLLWPTCVPRPATPPDCHMFRILTLIDGPGNACPSMHAAVAVFSGACVHTVCGWLGDRGYFRALSWVWCAGILYATLATKQHVAVDLVSGCALGALGALAWWRQVQRRGDSPHKDVCHCRLTSSARNG